jgi:hypothetical protein
MKNISSMLQKTYDFFWLSVFASVHEGKSGFRDLWWGANERGIHFAAGPDWMHLMEEGLGRHILTYIDAILQKAGLCENSLIFCWILSSFDVRFQVIPMQLTNTSKTCRAEVMHFRKAPKRCLTDLQDYTQSAPKTYQEFWCRLLVFFAFSQ